jgi:hypothetical protein
MFYLKVEGVYGGFPVIKENNGKLLPIFEIRAYKTENQRQKAAEELDEMGVYTAAAKYKEVRTYFGREFIVSADYNPQNLPRPLDNFMTGWAVEPEYYPV